MRSPARGCLSKRPYLSHVNAMITATKRVSKGAPPLRVYHCQHCKFWHLTKQVSREVGARVTE